MAEARGTVSSTCLSGCLSSPVPVQVRGMGEGGDKMPKTSPVIGGSAVQ
jgi:hypothetical protein